MKNESYQERKDRKARESRALQGAIIAERARVAGVIARGAEDDEPCPVECLEEWL